MEIKNIRMNACKLGKNSRLNIDKMELSGLMESIKTEGLLQPIGVTKKGKNYEVVYGNRRFLAYSKLGKKTIPAVIQDISKQDDIDIKNLAENVQRSNLTLTEVGRYINILEKRGMKTAELAVALGVPKSYITTAKRVYQSVPSKYREDIVATQGCKTIPRGKISMATVRLVENKRAQFTLDDKQTDTLYQAAKTQGFDFGRINQYVEKIKKSKAKNTKGSSVVRSLATENKRVHLKVEMPIDDYEKIWHKHIVKGPFKSMNEVFKAKINGQISTPMKVR